MELANRTFLVTGGASGLGAGTARRLVAHGANVVVADVNAAASETLVAELGSSARFAATDVTSPESGQAAVDMAIREFGSLHGLVSCAGILGASRIVGRDGPHDLAVFRQVIEVNLVGTFNMLRLAASAMSLNAPSAEGERGVIVNTASISVFEGQIGQAAYSASKGGRRIADVACGPRAFEVRDSRGCDCTGCVRDGHDVGRARRGPRFAGRSVGLSAPFRPGR